MTLEKPRFLERCPDFYSPKVESNRKIRIVRVGQQEFLTEKQIVDYYEFRKQFLAWLWKIGKNPDKAEGYSPFTVAATADRTARFEPGGKEIYATIPSQAQEIIDLFPEALPME